MLYVAAGLAAMFAVLALLGLGAIDQATQLVYRERLATAYTTAGILQRDLARIASDMNDAARELTRESAARTGPDADEILDHFDRGAQYLFFKVTGVWLLDGNGRIIEAAGRPGPSDLPGSGQTNSGLPPSGGSDFEVRTAVAPITGETAFASVAVRLSSHPSGAQAAIVHTVSINAKSDYAPESYGGADVAGGSPGPSPLPASGYHLEVVGPDGIAILGIGSDEQPGAPSHHFPEIRILAASRGAAALLHEPGPTDPFEAHVMAVVPLAASPFYVVIEQPVDIALALPNQLRQRLLVTTSVGFLAALLLAWITTRHVVKPTEELTSAASRMAQGDLASPIDVRADDEIGILAESLELMRRQLAAAREADARTRTELEERVADRTARLNQLLGQTINAQEDERRRLARELHDETAQTLAALTITLDRARDELDVPSDARAHIGEARTTAARLLAETRRLILGLRPGVLDDLGLLPAIRWYAETALADSGIEVEIEDAEGVTRLPEYLEVALFRIVQEAITNVARHAGARHLAIRFGVEAGLVTVTIADDGVGFDVERAAAGSSSSGSFGLIGMQERVRLVNGEMSIQSSPSGGTVIIVRVAAAVGAA